MSSYVVYYQHVKIFFEQDSDIDFGGAVVYAVIFHQKAHGTRDEPLKWVMQKYKMISKPLGGIFAGKNS